MNVWRDDGRIFFHVNVALCEGVALKNVSSIAEKYPLTHRQLFICLISFQKSLGLLLFSFLVRESDLCHFNTVTTGCDWEL